MWMACWNTNSQSATKVSIVNRIEIIIIIVNSHFSSFYLKREELTYQLADKISIVGSSWKSDLKILCFTYLKKKGAATIIIRSACFTKPPPPPPSEVTEWQLLNKTKKSWNNDASQINISAMMLLSTYSSPVVCRSYSVIACDNDNITNTELWKS